METLVGNSDLEVRAVGGVPDSVLARLAQLPFPITIHPRIEDYAVVADTGETVPLIGLDLVGDASSLIAVRSCSRQHRFQERRPESAQRCEQHLGQRAPRQEGRGQAAAAGERSRAVEYTVRGLLKDSANAGDFVVMDIATAQRDLARPGRVDRVLINAAPLRHAGAVGSEAAFRPAEPASNCTAKAAKPTRIAACWPRFAGTCASSATSRWWSARFSSTTPFPFRSYADAPRSASCVPSAPLAAR